MVSKRSDILIPCQHPNIILFMGAVVEERGMRAIVTEWMPLGSLWDLMHGGARIDRLTMLGMAMDCARGMRESHVRQTR